MLRLSQRVASRLEQEIREGLLGPGERLPTEAQLCARFGASRPSIREALGSLKGRGLVRSRRGSGTYVAEAVAEQVGDSLGWHAALRRDEQSFFELFDLRFLIESDCVRRLAEARPEAALAVLTARLAEMEASLADLPACAAADLGFHLAIVEGAGNRLFAEIMRGLYGHLGLRFARGTYTDIPLARKNLREHRRIEAAVREGDAERAVRELRAHLEESRRHFAAMLAEPTAP
jgi:DNA-binding FadR family transcriptional regulator